MLNYDFVQLNPEQVERRRRLLDQAGYYAYVTPIVLLIAIFVFRSLSSLLGKEDGKSSFSGKKPSAVTVATRRLNWMLDNTYLAEFGPLRVQVIGVLYTAWLIYLIFSNTGNDYMHLAKAFGHVGVSQLPLQYLLVIKSHRSPITMVTGLTHERLNSYHRLFGRVVHLLLATHASLYLNFFVKKDLLAKRIRDWDVRLGVMAFWTVNIMGLLALPSVRKKAYHAVFYLSHIFLGLILPLIVWFHVPYTRLYVAQAIAFAFINGIMRKNNAQKVSVVCESVSTALFTIKMRTATLGFDQFQAGMHIYLRQGSAGPRTPFTVLELEPADMQGDVEIKLLAKDSGGPTTGKLNNPKVGKDAMKLELEGPYGESAEYMPALLAGHSATDSILLISGGVGASYTLPIYKSLVAVRGSSQRVKIVLVFKSALDAKWAVGFLQQEILTLNVEMYVTREAGDGDLEIDTDSKGIKVFPRRPDFERIVNDFFNTKLASGGRSSKSDPRKRNFDPITIMSCGPAKLSKNLREAVGRHVMDYGREVRWYEEQFGFGG